MITLKYIPNEKEFIQKKIHLCWLFPDIDKCNYLWSVNYSRVTHFVKANNFYMYRVISSFLI